MLNTETIDKIYYNDEIKARIADADTTVDYKVKALAEALQHYRERALELEGVPEEINKYIREHEQEVCKGYVMGGAPARLRTVIQHYRGIATNALSSCERFRDDLHAWLRGMVICLEMTGNAGTHAEKGARLRGAIEIAEATIQKVIDNRFDFDSPYWRWKDTFRSDFPTRELLEQKHNLQRELEEAKRQIAELRGVKPEEVVTDINF